MHFIAGFLGERGLPGPRGRPGKNGVNGDQGKPGVNLWTIDDKRTDSFLIPPMISGEQHDKVIVVREGDHLKLTCAASGIPKPLISWSKIDGDAFPDGAWKSK